MRDGVEVDLHHYTRKKMWLYRKGQSKEVKVSTCVCIFHDSASATLSIYADFPLQNQVLGVRVHDWYSHAERIMID
ncbi:MAG: hypothetical protein C4532_03870 [Candidatus Abyssobacteria bacterium SURF_17]|uniref:Uncharacterized protein n=1 Tax=Candidatus Abyssobacteria bacterium SURF_17 TaxID=2093361 RepID=A0A419F5P7_9BACT|nr:MAG: hypothetical protein C4532_03870 [Candidatus Abyssubacteria bacterium SURF_17]